MDNAHLEDLLRGDVSATDNDAQDAHECASRAAIAEVAWLRDLLINTGVDGSSPQPRLL